MNPGPDLSNNVSTSFIGQTLYPHKKIIKIHSLLKFLIIVNQKTKVTENKLKMGPLTIQDCFGVSGIYDLGLSQYLIPSSFWLDPAHMWKNQKICSLLLELSSAQTNTQTNESSPKTQSSGGRNV